jgi:hypothetical protein
LFSSVQEQSWLLLFYSNYVAYSCVMSNSLSSSYINFNNELSVDRARTYHVNIDPFYLFYYPVHLQSIYLYFRMKRQYPPPRLLALSIWLIISLTTSVDSFQFGDRLRSRNPVDYKYALQHRTVSFQYFSIFWIFTLKR